MKRVPPAKYVWLDGEYVPWEEAKIHVATDCVRRGSSVFEGIRAYWNNAKEELYVFRFKEHMDRLYNSAKIMRMQPQFTCSDLMAASIELLIKNGFREDVAFRLELYFGIGRGKGYFSYTPDTIYTGAYITAVPRPSKLSSKIGLNVCVSSWTRIADRDVPPRVKAGANYQNSRLAAVQATVDGYDTAVMLNDMGKVAEGPGACIFLIRDGVPITPSVTSGILESITRATVIQLFQEEFGLNTVERQVDRTELYVADETFFCGTAYEITPIVSIDRYPVGDGSIGQVTEKMQRLYAQIVRGLHAKYTDWLYPVYHPKQTMADVI